MVDSSTIFETDENVFVLLHDHAEDRSAEGIPLLLGDLSTLELLEHGIVLIGELFIHYREDCRRSWRTGQDSSLALTQKAIPAIPKTARTNMLSVVKNIPEKIFMRTCAASVMSFITGPIVGLGLGQGNSLVQKISLTLVVRLIDSWH